MALACVPKGGGGGGGEASVVAVKSVRPRAQTELGILGSWPSLIMGILGSWNLGILVALPLSLRNVFHAGVCAQVICWPPTGAICSCCFEPFTCLGDSREVPRTLPRCLHWVCAGCVLLKSPSKTRVVRPCVCLALHITTWQFYTSTPVWLRHRARRTLLRITQL